MRSVASLSATPGARLKEIVTAGSWPRCVTLSGPIFRSEPRHRIQGHQLAGFERAHVKQEKRRRVFLVLRGSTSRITGILRVIGVYIVETSREPKALKRVSSICSAVIPSVAALSRLIFTRHLRGCSPVNPTSRPAVRARPAFFVAKSAATL